MSSPTASAAHCTVTFRSTSSPARLFIPTRLSPTRERSLVGIRKATDSKSQSAYIVRSTAPRGNRPPSSYVLSGIAFAAYYGIPTEEARRWTARAEDGMLIVDLNEPGMKVTSNRTRKGETNQERVRVRRASRTIRRLAYRSLSLGGASSR